jgi:hypothetical protein
MKASIYVAIDWSNSLQCNAEKVEEALKNCRQHPLLQRRKKEKPSFRFPKFLGIHGGEAAFEVYDPEALGFLLRALNREYEAGIEARVVPY